MIGKEVFLMYENNYNYNNDNNNYNTNNPETENINGSLYGEAPRKKSSGIKKIIKPFLIFLCMAAVSAGSIAGYRYIEENGLPFTEKAQKTEARPLPVENEDSSEELSSDAESAEELLREASLIDIRTHTEPIATQAIYKKVLPSVVGITAVFQYQSPTIDFWGFSSDPTTSEVPYTGTGIVMSEDGYILTNAHIITDDNYGVSSRVTILMADETEYEATIVGYDRQTDLAVLKADAEGLTPAEFGSSRELKVGDPAFAIGNPLGFELFGTLTAGYISGLEREISVNDTTMKLVQTDAAINSGNSGGPLINEAGQVVGINSMKLSSSYSSAASVEGLGFAIPIDDAKEIIDDLTTYGYVTGRPQLGITYRDLSQSGSSYYSQGAASNGVLVVSVNKNGPADKAGIKAGDIIVGADGELVSGADDLKAAISECDAGDKIRLTIVRNRNYYDTDVTLEDAHPDNTQDR